MKDKIAIITDSCADVDTQYKEKYDIYVLPMVITCADGEYKDGVNIFSEDVYERLKTDIPKTSSPEIGDVLDTIELVKSRGYNKAVMIMLSSGLSGTVSHMRIVAQQEKEIEIEVYDSLQASIGIGAIAIQAAMYAAEGIGFEELKKKIEKLIDGTKVFFSIDTLEYLQKGGRIGRAKAFVGTVLQIKPILSFDDNDGQIYVPSKVRGSKGVPKELIRLLSERVDVNRPFNLMVADGGNPEGRDMLETELKKLFPGFTIIFKARIGAALSVYLGDRLLGVGIQYLD